jgi:hypothetical protein
MKSVQPFIEEFNELLFLAEYSKNTTLLQAEVLYNLELLHLRAH